MGPPGHCDDFADRGFADLAAVMSAHKLKKPQGKRAILRLDTAVGKPDQGVRAGRRRPG
jgi:hypothetical protein